MASSSGCCSPLPLCLLPFLSHRIVLPHLLCLSACPPLFFAMSSCCSSTQLVKPRCYKAVSSFCLFFLCLFPFSRHGISNPESLLFLVLGCSLLQPALALHFRCSWLRLACPHARPASSWHLFMCLQLFGPHGFFFTYRKEIARHLHEPSDDCPAQRAGSLGFGLLYLYHARYGQDTLGQVFQSVLVRTSVLVPARILPVRFW
jgi:hypothetical protein